MNPNLHMKSIRRCSLPKLTIHSLRNIMVKKTQIACRHNVLETIFSNHIRAPKQQQNITRNVSSRNHLPDNCESNRTYLSFPKVLWDISGKWFCKWSKKHCTDYRKLTVSWFQRNRMQITNLHSPICYNTRFNQIGKFTFSAWKDSNARFNPITPIVVIVVRLCLWVFGWSR